MPNYRDKIKELVAGDDKDVVRTITLVPVGQVLVKGWLTVKRKETDLDQAAIFQKVIDTNNTGGVGWVEDLDASDGQGIVHFYLQPAQTSLLQDGKEYYFDIQVKTDTGKIYTPIKGTVKAQKSVTRATS